MNNDVLKGRLMAAREIIDSVLYDLQQADAVDVPDDPDDAEVCRHPEDQRQDISTMGGRQWYCRLCGHVGPVGEHSTGGGPDR